MKILRKEYRSKPLKLKDLHKDPFQQFSQWYHKACQSEILEPNAMILATVNQDKKPSTRTVLLKFFDEKGFVFFTNYQSKKAKEIEKNPFVSVTFLWMKIFRQITISGKVKRVSQQFSQKYFEQRPRNSQIAAWASNQSHPIKSRQLLELAFKKYKQKFYRKKVPLPPFWGGYLIVPNYFEFWQGRKDRLHDRFSYTLQEKGGWKIQRLAP